MLLQRQDLDLDTVILLDRVQKRLPISDAMITKLRRDGLIEGRKPNIYVSETVAQLTGTEASYTRSKGADKAYLKKLVIAYLAQSQGAARDAIEALLLPLLPAILSAEQKRNRVKNLLSEMKRGGLILPDREGRGAIWNVRDVLSRNV